MWLISQNSKAQEESMSVAWFLFGAMVTNTVVPYMHYNDHMIPQIKSMAQHLHRTGNLASPRKKRFPANYYHDMEMLTKAVSIEIAEKHIKRFAFARGLNTSLAFFLMDAYSLMDRGFVSHLIRCYVRHVRCVIEYRPLF